MAADPECPLRILEDGGSHLRGLAELGGNGGEAGIANLIHTGHFAGNPETALAVTVNRFDEVAGEAVVTREGYGLTTLQANEPLARADPEATPDAVGDGVDHPEIKTGEDARELIFLELVEAFASTDVEHVVLTAKDHEGTSGNFALRRELRIE